MADGKYLTPDPTDRRNLSKVERTPKVTRGQLEQSALCFDSFWSRMREGLRDTSKDSTGGGMENIHDTERVGGISI